MSASIHHFPPMFSNTHTYDGCRIVSFEATPQRNNSGATTFASITCTCGYTRSKLYGWTDMMVKRQQDHVCDLCHGVGWIFWRD